VRVYLTLSQTATTRQIVGVPKAESDAVLAFLYSQISDNITFHMRHKWEPNDVVIWDNRVSLSILVSPFSFFGHFGSPD
jgi:sulfonate dioxygenase